MKTKILGKLVDTSKVLNPTLRFIAEHETEHLSAIQELGNVCKMSDPRPGYPDAGYPDAGYPDAGWPDSRGLVLNT